MSSKAALAKQACSRPLKVAAGATGGGVGFAAGLDQLSVALPQEGLSLGPLEDEHEVGVTWGQGPGVFEGLAFLRVWQPLPGLRRWGSQLQFGEIS